MKYFNLNNSLISILLFIDILHAFETPCGDAHQKVYIDDTSFIVIYSNTQDRKKYENRYSLDGKIIYKRKEIKSDTLFIKALKTGVGGLVPTGINSPLGDYHTPFGICFLKDTTLYTIANPSSPENVKYPYLEIKQGKLKKQVYKLDWQVNKLTKFQQIIVRYKFLRYIYEKLFKVDLDKYRWIEIQRTHVDGNKIFGIASFEEDSN